MCLVVLMSAAWVVVSGSSVSRKHPLLKGGLDVIMANDEKKRETRGTPAGLLNDRMMLSVRQKHAAGRRSRREKLGCAGITATWFRGGMSHIGVAWRWQLL